MNAQMPVPMNYPLQNAKYVTHLSIQVLPGLHECTVACAHESPSSEYEVCNLPVYSGPPQAPMNAQMPVPMNYLLQNAKYVTHLSVQVLPRLP